MSLLVSCIIGQSLLQMDPLLAYRASLALIPETIYHRFVNGHHLGRGTSSVPIVNSVRDVPMLVFSLTVWSRVLMSRETLPLTPPNAPLTDTPTEFCMKRKTAADDQYYGSGLSTKLISMEVTTDDHCLLQNVHRHLVSTHITMHIYIYYYLDTQFIVSS